MATKTKINKFFSINFGHGDEVPKLGISRFSKNILIVARKAQR